MKTFEVLAKAVHAQNITHCFSLMWVMETCIFLAPLPIKELASHTYDMNISSIGWRWHMRVWPCEGFATVTCGPA